MYNTFINSRLYTKAYKEEKIIRNIKAFFITLMLYILIASILYLIFYKKITFPSSSASEKSITLNIQQFDPASSAMPSSPENIATTESSTLSTEKEEESITQPIEEKNIEETTKSIFEKIVNAGKPPATKSNTVEKTSNYKKITKRLFQKIENSENEVKKILKEKTKLGKLKQEALAKAKAKQKALKQAQKKAKLAKLEQERLAQKKHEEEVKKALKEKTKKEVQLKAIAQQKVAKQKLLAKKKKEKKRKEKLHKIKLAKEKKRKAKQAKAALAKKRKKKKAKNALANTIMNSSSSYSKGKKSKSSMRMINKFYGSEFNTFTGTQKNFIKKNLGNIYQITQRTLSRNGYPEVAARTQQQGTQLVTFYLHPDGSITGLRFKRRLRISSLDNNTIKVIKIAYKDYPRPKTTTKITFYVQYSLF